MKYSRKKLILLLAKVRVVSDGQIDLETIPSYNAQEILVDLEDEEDPSQPAEEEKAPPSQPNSQVLPAFSRNTCKHDLPHASAQNRRAADSRSEVG